MIEFKIDPEFREKIPAMPTEDFEGLRTDIIRDGYVRDPLVVWKEENILLDGHHRWRVIQENQDLLGNKFQVDYKSFPDRWAAIAWICANQLHKHNMNEMQRMKLMQEEYEARQHSEKFKGNQHTAKSGGEEIHHHQDENLIDGSAIPFEYKTGKEPKTREILAKEHNVSPGIIQTAVEVGRGIDRAAEVDPEFKREVLSGEIKAKKSDLAEIRRMQSDEEVKEAIEVIRDPSKKRGGSWANKEIRDRYAQIREISKEMGKAKSGTTFDDVVGLLNTIGDDFISKVERTINSERETLTSDERWPDAIDGYFDSIIEDIKELKGRILK
ncbi:MAG: hypothetical protein J6S14_03020 [Clostridia bacterium]|nr:hypothetical protein [Clostridia bacterium]